MLKSFIAAEVTSRFCKPKETISYDGNCQRVVGGNTSVMIKTLTRFALVAIPMMFWKAKNIISCDWSTEQCWFGVIFIVVFLHRYFNLNLLQSLTTIVDYWRASKLLGNSDENEVGKLRNFYDVFEVEEHAFMRLKSWAVLVWDPFECCMPDVNWILL